MGKIELYDFCCNYYDCEEVTKNKLHKFYNN